MVTGRGTIFYCNTEKDCKPRLKSISFSMRWDYPPLDINPVFPGLKDYYYYHYYVLRRLMGKPWGFSAQDAILCQNGWMPHKNSEVTIKFMWNLDSLCIHNLANTIPLVGYGQGLVHSTCLTWDFLNTYHMFFHEAIRSVLHRRPIKVTSTPVQQPEFERWTMWLLLLGFCPSTQYNGPFKPAN